MNIGFFIFDGMNLCNFCSVLISNTDVPVPGYKVGDNVRDNGRMLHGTRWG